MSGSFFGDLIRFLLEDGGLHGTSSASERRLSGRADPAGRFSVYCVDLLGYGKSASLPSRTNYSRQEQASLRFERRE